MINKVNPFLMEPFFDDFTWSYSRLNSFKICKRMFYYRYIMGLKSTDNFFSQYGLFNHEIFEKYANGDLKLWELPEYFSEHYDEKVTLQAPISRINLNETYYDAGINYWSNFNGFEDKTLNAEMEIKFPIHGDKKDYQFIGYIDRVAEDEYGIILSDYKSKGKFKSKHERYDLFNQLYLYAEGVKSIYNQYPYLLQINRYRVGEIDSEVFDIKESKERIENNIISVIEDIYKETDYIPVKNRSSNYFCNNLCAFKDRCVEDTDDKELEELYK